MASIIRIKRSSVSGNPATLGTGELAYSALADNGSNGGDRLYVGMGSETSGNAVNHLVIGGKYFTDKLDHNPGTLTSTSAIITDADSKIDNLLVDNLQLNGNTLSTTNANGDLLIAPNGSGKTVVSNLYIGDNATSITEFIYDTVGGTITAGTGITSTPSDGGNTTTLSVTNTGVTAGSYGSATAIPTFTVNAQGQLTVAGSVSVATTLTLTGDTGTDGISLLSESLSVVGGEGIDTAITANTLTISAEDATTTNKGVASFDTNNFTVSSGAVSTKTITLGSSTLTVGSTTSSLAGLTSLGVTGAATVGATLGVTGATTLSSTLAVTSNATVGGTLGVTGIATFGSSIDMAAHKIVNLAEPTNDSDAATKYYVDAARSGLDIKQSVVVATTANITLSNTQTIDGIALSVGMRVLVKDQATPTQNGIYIVASGAWTRSADADQPDEMNPGTFVFVERGAVNSDTGFVVTSDGTLTIGTDPIAWTLFSSSGTLIAGAGLSKNGYTLEVNVAGSGGIEVVSDNLQLKSSLAGAGLVYGSGILDIVGTANRLTVNADSIDIASTYVGQTSITTLGTITTGSWTGSVIADAYINDALTISGGTVNNTPVGASVRSTGAFTTLHANSTLGVTGATTLSSTLGVTGNVTLSANITGAGAAVSTLDGFNIDGGTY